MYLLWQVATDGPKISFLSDPSPIIGDACQLLTNSLTDWLTDCCLVNLIDVTLACEDAYLKLVEVVTVADVDENCVGNNILQIWKLRFGHKAKFFPDFQHNVWSGFEVGVQARFLWWKDFLCWKKAG